MSIKDLGRFPALKQIPFECSGKTSALCRNACSTFGIRECGPHEAWVTDHCLFELPVDAGPFATQNPAGTVKAFQASGSFLWPMQVVLYSRQGCHLCHDALALLKQHALDVQVIDIDQDPALRTKYNDCVPVVEIEGRERFRGHVDERLLLRLLAGSL